MANDEVSMDLLVGIVREAMVDLIEAGDLDVVRSDDGLEIDVFGDEWTIHLEGWPGSPSAFAAIDDEPEDPAAMSAALAAIIDAPIQAALLDLDRRLGRALRTALAASGDPLSIDLATALGEG